MVEALLFAPLARQHITRPTCRLRFNSSGNFAMFAAIRRASSRGAAQVKCQLFCRKLRQTVRQKRVPSPNRKSTNGSNFVRRGILYVQIGADAMRLVKAANLTVQFDIQPIRGDRHLDNEGVFPLVGERLTGAIKMTFTATLYATRSAWGYFL
jgi:hypothetical protein